MGICARDKRKSDENKKERVRVRERERYTTGESERYKRVRE